MHVFAQEANLLCVSYFPGNFKRIQEMTTCLEITE